MLSDGEIWNHRIDVVLTVLEIFSFLSHHSLDNSLSFSHYTLQKAFIFVAKLFYAPESCSELAERFPDPDNLHQIFYAEDIFFHAGNELLEELLVGWLDDSILLAVCKQKDLFLQKVSPRMQDWLIEFWNVAGIAEIIDHRVEMDLYVLNSVSDHRLPEHTLLYYLSLEKDPRVFVER